MWLSGPTGKSTTPYKVVCDDRSRTGRVVAGGLFCMSVSIKSWFDIPAAQRQRQLCAILCNNNIADVIRSAGRLSHCFNDVIVTIAFSSRELLTILTAPGPNQMSKVQAKDIVDEMLQKYDANNDKRFSYIGNRSGNSSRQHPLQLLFLTNFYV